MASSLQNNYTHSCLEEKPAVPIVVDLGHLHGFVQDLLGFGVATLGAVDVGQDASGLETNVVDGRQVLAHEPLEQDGRRDLSIQVRRLAAVVTSVTLEAAQLVAKCYEAIFPVCLYNYPAPRKKVLV